MILSGILARGRRRVKANAPSRGGRIARCLPALAWMAGVFWLSHQTAPLGVQGNETASIVAHLALYTGLALVLSLALVPNEHSRTAIPPWVVPAYAFALAVLYGALDEVHQAFVAGRTASNADLGLDAVGAAIGALATLFLSTLPRRWRQG